MTLPRALLTACLLGSAAFLPSCGSSTTVAERENVGFWIQSSDSDIVAGELVTVSANSRNTLGKKPSVKWSSTGGDVSTESDGRVARVKFNEPGAYTVTARLELDGVAVDEDSVDIKVRPLR